MAIPKDVRKKVHEKFGERCAYCGTDIKDRFQVDHIIAQSDFLHQIKTKSKHIPMFLRHLKESDVNHIDNLFPTCTSCNSYKNSMSLTTFRKEVSEMLRKLDAYSTIYRIAYRFGMIKENKKKIIFYFETTDYNKYCNHK